jgi:hypothetical protein
MMLFSRDGRSRIIDIIRSSSVKRGASNSWKCWNTVGSLKSSKDGISFTELLT